MEKNLENLQRLISQFYQVEKEIYSYFTDDKINDIACVIRNILREYDEKYWTAEAHQWHSNFDYLAEYMDADNPLSNFELLDHEGIKYFDTQWIEVDYSCGDIEQIGTIPTKCLFLNGAELEKELIEMLIN